MEIFSCTGGRHIIEFPKKVVISIMNMSKHIYIYINNIKEGDKNESRARELEMRKWTTLEK